MFKLLSLIGIVVLSASAAMATALKACNDTPYSWRASVDGGSWQDLPPQGACRCYQSARCPSYPGDIHNPGWVDIKNGVSGSRHAVRFQYLSPSGWVDAPFGVINMRGDYRTNIAQLIDGGGTPGIRMWWEPNHDENRGAPCRDKPPADCRQTSCLRPH
jgi:hypothetical protein